MEKGSTNPETAFESEPNLIRFAVRITPEMKDFMSIYKKMSEFTDGHTVKSINRTAAEIITQMLVESDGDFTDVYKQYQANERLNGRRSVAVKMPLENEIHVRLREVATELNVTPHRVAEAIMSLELQNMQKDYPMLRVFINAE